MTHHEVYQWLLDQIDESWTYQKNVITAEPNRNGMSFEVTVVRDHYTILCTYHPAELLYCVMYLDPPHSYLDVSYTHLTAEDFQVKLTELLAEAALAQ